VLGGRTIDNGYVQDVLIIGSGEPPPAELLARWASHADLVIAADGGCVAARAAGIEPDVVIGDLDSLPAALRREASFMPPAVHEHPRDKDWSDLELAIDHALASAPDRVTLTGVLRGARTDHELAAVFLLEKLVRAGVRSRILRLGERLDLVCDTWISTDLPIGSIVSLLPVTGEVSGIVTEGLRFPLAGEPLRRAASRGLSNRVVSVPVTVHLQQGLLLIVSQVDAAPHSDRIALGKEPTWG